MPKWQSLSKIQIYSVSLWYILRLTPSGHGGFTDMFRDMSWLSSTSGIPAHNTQQYEDEAVYIYIYIDRLHVYKGGLCLKASAAPRRKPGLVSWYLTLIERDIYSYIVFTTLKIGWGYTHYRRADKYPYPHDRHANKDSYPHNRNVTDDLCSLIMSPPVGLGDILFLPWSSVCHKIVSTL